jgi:hypothetical protein
MIIETSLDMLENGTVSELSAHLTSLTQTFLTLFKNRLAFGPESDMDPNPHITTSRNPKSGTIPIRLVTLPMSATITYSSPLDAHPAFPFRIPCSPLLHSRSADHLPNCSKGREPPSSMFACWELVRRGGETRSGN